MKVERCIYCGCSEKASFQFRCMNTRHCFDIVPVSPPEVKDDDDEAHLKAYAKATKPKPRKRIKIADRIKHILEETIIMDKLSIDEAVFYIVKLIQNNYRRRKN